MTNKVESKRIIYNPSEFAKKSLIYLQETGISKTNRLNTNSRDKLDSYLFFIVIDGTGTITYNNKTTNLAKGSCVFIDCNNKYSHTSDNWTIKWVHFNGINVIDLYNEYVKRKGQNIFNTERFIEYDSILNDLQLVSKSSDLVKDISIYEKLVALLSLILSETAIEIKRNKCLYNIKDIKEYIDIYYLNNISLKSISNKFFINKYYLARLFKKTYGTTINNYILNARISKAKTLLRFSDLNINIISKECGFNDNNYFSRSFKQIEGKSPKEYKKSWN